MHILHIEVDEFNPTFCLFSLLSEQDSIANATEGVFTYVESDSMVTDAFGGTIGTQQGVSLSNISLNITACEREVIMTQVLAGRYNNTLQSDGRTASVNFVNMFMGESRDVLFKLSVPAVSEAVEDYELIRATATFQVQGQRDANVVYSVPQPVACAVQRLPKERMNSAQVRDLEVDVQINRMDISAAVTAALKEADAMNFGAAREIVTAAKARLESSVSFQAKHTVVLALMQEIEDALQRVQSRSQYESGGRAMMQECVTTNAYQRSTYTKAGKVAKYQTKSSSSMQEKACVSKGGFF